MKLTLVSPRTGLQWVRQGLQLFMRQPLALGSLFMLILLASSLIGSLPLLGSAVALALAPAGTVGMMRAAQLAQQGRRPPPAVLLAAFTQGPHQSRAILLLGAIYAAAMLLAIALGDLLDDGQLQALLTAYQGKPAADMMQDARMPAAVQAALGHMALMTALYLPISLLFWHAPALVHWRQVPVGKALFFSIVGVLRNGGAYLLFGLGWAGVFAVAYLLTVMAGMLLGNILLTGMLLVSVSLSLMAAASTSMWLTFQGSFEPVAAAPGRT